ncbi:MAG: 4a-hydroxytetrahydrobiopterin dehydratase [Alphaproteobacteria bacterium]|nr:MAG: 4a-hydroxytetrahydrobiopterin dehydratase [Alphaproteobacteria bacterium]
MTETPLSRRRCKDLPKGTPALADAAARALLAELHPDWRIDGAVLTRRFALKGFAPAVMLANAAAFLAERENHHPDIGFGWGWCAVSFTTHSVGGLSENDFICAAKLDELVAGGGAGQ